MTTAKKKSEATTRKRNRGSLHAVVRPRIVTRKFLVTAKFGTHIRGIECSELREVLAIVDYQIPHGADEIQITVQRSFFDGL